MPKATVIVENDAVAALCSGTGGELSGIVVISGTGSIGFGATPGGAQRFRAGSVRTRRRISTNCFIMTLNSRRSLDTPRTRT